MIVFGADVFGPNRLAARNATVAPFYRPRTRQRIVFRRDLVVESVRIGGIERKPLIDHGLSILVKRKPAAVVAVRALHAAGFDDERVVAAIAVGVLPFADGIARER